MRIEGVEEGFAGFVGCEEGTGWRGSLAEIRKISAVDEWERLRGIGPNSFVKWRMNFRRRGRLCRGLRLGRIFDKWTRSHILDQQG